MSIGDGISAAYPLNATNTLKDFFTTAPDLVAVGTPTNNAGKIAEAEAQNGYLLSDVGSYLKNTGDIFSLRPVGAPAAGVDWSASFWVYPTSIAGSPGYLSNWANHSAGPVQWLCYDDGFNTIFQVRDAGGGDHAASAARLTINTWQLVTLTFNATSHAVTISINAGARATAAAATVAEGIGALQVGNRNNAGAAMAGAFDNLIFYDRTLTTDEEAELYNAGAGDEPPFAVVGTDQGAFFVLG